MDNFDVNMGSFDFTQIADLVGFYILNTIGRILNLNWIRLYRDDGLIYIPSSNSPITLKLQRKNY